MDVLVDDLQYLEKEIANMAGVLDVQSTVPAAGHVLLTVSLRDLDFDIRRAVLTQVDAFHRRNIERLSVEVRITGPSGPDDIAKDD